MVSAGNDPSWRTQVGEPSTLDDLITADGQAGRLVELTRNGSVIGFHTHWQSLFSEGRATFSMRLDEPTDLLSELEELSVLDFKVRHNAPDNLILDVDEEQGPEQQAA